MKKLIILFLFSLFTFSAMMGQSKTIYVLDSATNELISNTPEKAKDVKTKYYIVLKETIYPVYISSTGRWYIKKISSKTLAEYKYYINVQLAK